MISSTIHETHERDTGAQLSSQGDIRRALAVLQQLQALLGREPVEHDPSLADLVLLLRAMQREFGPLARLEDVIQQLVAQDIERQLIARTLRRSPPSTEGVRQEAVA